MSIKQQAILINNLNNMQKLISISVLSLFLLFAFEIKASKSMEIMPNSSVADIVENVQEAVVNISTSQIIKSDDNKKHGQIPEGELFEEFFKRFGEPNKKTKPRKVKSLGSGFVIDSKGVIITNHHVIKEADEIIVNFNNGESLTATVKGSDPKTDIAVLIVEPDKPLEFISFENEKVRVGEDVIAIGNPLGLGGTVTKGIISALNRNINQGPYDNFIQTDASINRGNSGGPLLNLKGKVVGINTAIISPSGFSIGIGFSIPAKIAQPVIKQLVDFGETRRGWLGVRLQEVSDDIAESLGLDEKKGALVASVFEDSPAEDAGFKAGDIILKFDGKDVPTLRDLPLIVAETKVGKRVNVIVFREGREKTLKAKIGRLEENEKMAQAQEDGDEKEEAKSSSALGLTLSTLTNDLRKKFNINDEIEGVVITDVVGTSDAYEKGIREGNVITEISHTKISSPDEFIEQVEKAKDDGKRTIFMFITNRSGNGRFIALPIEDK